MEIVEFLVPSAPLISQSIPQVGAGDFLMTLMAMAGHDLRQPLQLITSAHDVLATMPLTKEQRRELAQAANAVTQLAGMLDQLVEALQLPERAQVGVIRAGDTIVPSSKAWFDPAASVGSPKSYLSHSASFDHWRPASLRLTAIASAFR